MCNIVKYFNGLTLFAKIVELKSFTEASRQLHLPMTTLSRKISQLEHDLGGKLINRNARHFSLTELGERVLPKALLILETLDELQHEAEEVSTQPIGTLRITAPRAFGCDILAKLLSDFRLQYPSIRIELSTTNRIQDLTKGNIDFAFRVGDLVDSSLIAMPLTRVDYELVASPDWLTKNGSISHPMELAAFTTIRNHVDGFVLPWQFHKGSEIYQHQSEPVILSDDLSTSVVFALSGAGIAYLPFAMVKPFLKSGSLVAILNDWSKQKFTMNMLYPNRSYLPQKSRLFISFIKNCIPDLQKQMTNTE